MNVLLLDDEPIVGKRLKPALEKLGCTVETYEDPVKALARIEEQEFDVVITDVYMKEVDGIQILEQVHRKSARTKVIVITGYAMMELARKAMGGGAYDFIAKPFKPDELREVVSRAARDLGLELKPAPFGAP
jgi:DNA-binding NtrC family response regulator